MARGIDYAFSPHPSVGAMQGAGIHFVGRYVSQLAINDQNGKNLLPAERRGLADGRIAIILFAEPGDPEWMRGGHAAGVAQAEHFDAVTKALGMPGIPAYYAADFDAPPGDQPAINACLDGASSVRGPELTGIYGGYHVVKRALDGGHARYACQTLAWSGAPRRNDPHSFWDGQTNWDKRAQVRQHLQIKVGGVSVDLDQSQAADYGQWPRPSVTSQATPAPVPPQKRSAPGGVSLRHAANAESTTVARALFLMAQDPTSVQRGGFGDLQRNYIGGEDWDAPMRTGMTYWVG